MLRFRAGLEKVARYFVSFRNKISTTCTAPVRREIPVDLYFQDGENLVEGETPVQDSKPD